MRIPIDPDGELADVIDLAAARRRREQPDEPGESRRTYAKATGPDEVELWIAINGHGMPEVVTTPDNAERIGWLMIRAAREARNLRMPPCGVCGHRLCLDWHVGKRYRGGRKGRRVHVVCERICKTSVRLRDLETGERFYAGSRYNWQPVDGPA